MTTYYETNLQHILDELKRIDLLIYQHVLRIRQKAEDAGEFRGLYISEEEIDAILYTTYPASDDEDPRIQTLKGLITEIETEIAEKKVESMKRGITLNLPLLANIFGLTSFEIEAVLISMAPELDTKYERLYAYLQNDATKKQPSVDLVLNLLFNSNEERLYARRYFDAGAHLFRHRILQFVEEPQEAKKPLLSRFIKLDDRIINYILGFNQIDRKIEPFAELIQPQMDLEAMQLPEELVERLNSLISHREITGGKLVCFLHGRYGAGKKTIAQGICKELGIPLLTVDVAALITREVDVEDTISRIFREAVLQNSALYLEHVERVFSEDVKYSFYKNLLFKALEPDITSFIDYPITYLL